ncbi:MAG: hypothetical protein JWM40_748 [Frankiales bacterium]|nr:hypothetical protein [Frankiales bacterium]
MVVHNGVVKLRPLLAVLPATTLLLAGCGGSSTPVKADDPVLSTTAPGTSGAATTSPGAGASPGATATATSGSSDRSTEPTSSASSAANPNVVAPADQFTPPGTYTYDSHGTITAGTPRKVDGTQELKVDKPIVDRQHSSLGGDQGSTDQDVSHSNSGTYLVRLKLSAAGQPKEFKPEKPVLGHPRPAAIGKTWSWSMTSTDGKTHAAYSARIARQETLTIGGTKVPTWVIESTLKLTGDIVFTDAETTWYDDVRLLQVKTHSKGSGTISGIAFTTDVTSTMRSVKPA